MLFFLIPIIIVLTCVFLVRIFLLVVTIEGSSMSPLLEDGDRVLVLRYFPIRVLRRSEILVLDLSKAASIPAPKPTAVIKRLAGLPGNIVRLPASEVEQDVLYATMSILSEDGFYEMQVPANHI